MGEYTQIRGWLECSYENLYSVENIVKEHWSLRDKYIIDLDEAILYKKGWCFPSHANIGLSIIFYGMSIKSRALDFFEDCFSKIAHSDLEVYGMIFVDDFVTDKQSSLWVLTGSDFKIVERTERYFDLTYYYFGNS